MKFRNWVAAGLILVSIAPSLHAETPDCPDSLVPLDETELLVTNDEIRAALDQELRAIIAIQPVFKKVYENLRFRLTRNKVLKQCLAASNTGGCTIAQLSEAAQDAITKTPSGLVKGYSLLLTWWTIQAAAIAKITSLAGEPALFLPTFATTLGLQIIAMNGNLTSSQNDRVAAALKKNGAYFSKPKEADSSLEGTAARNNATYTFREKEASDRILQFRTAALETTAAFLKAVENGNLPTLGAIVGDLIELGYLHLREIGPQHRTVLGALNTLLRNVSDRKRLIPFVWAHLIRPDKAPVDSEEQQYYRKAVETWLEGR